MQILSNKQTGEFKAWPREDQGDVIGLDTDTFDIYTLTEHDRPTFDAGTHYLQRTEVIDEQAKTVTHGWDIIAREQPAVVVTMRSLQLALVDAGLYQTVTAVINGIPDATDKLKTQIYWAKSNTVARDHLVVIGLVSALTSNGVTLAQVDAVFAAAQQLDNPQL